MDDDEPSGHCYLLDASYHVWTLIVRQLVSGPAPRFPEAVNDVVSLHTTCRALRDALYAHDAYVLRCVVRFDGRTWDIIHHMSRRVSPRVPFWFVADAARHGNAGAAAWMAVCLRYRPDLVPTAHVAPARRNEALFAYLHAAARHHRALAWECVAELEFCRTHALEHERAQLCAIACGSADACETYAQGLYPRGHAGTWWAHVAMMRAAALHAINGRTRETREALRQAAGILSNLTCSYAFSPHFALVRADTWRTVLTHDYLVAAYGDATSARLLCDEYVMSCASPRCARDGTLRERILQEPSVRSTVVKAIINVGGERNPIGPKRRAFRTWWRAQVRDAQRDVRERRLWSAHDTDLPAWVSSTPSHIAALRTHDALTYDECAALAWNGCHRWASAKTRAPWPPWGEEPECAV